MPDGGTGCSEKGTGQLPVGRSRSCGTQPLVLSVFQRAVVCCSSVCRSHAAGMPRGLKRGRGVWTPPVLLRQAVRRAFALEKGMTHREIWVDACLFHWEAVATCVQSCNKCVDVSSGVSITFFSYVVFLYMKRLLQFAQHWKGCLCV